MLIKVVPSHPEFSVDNLANVYKTSNQKLLSPFIDKDGYRRYRITVNKINHHIGEHRAVAEVFVHNPNPHKFNIVNHLDGNPANNLPCNLEWTDYSGNRVHANFIGSYKNSYGEKHSCAILTEDIVHSICKRLELGCRVCDIADTFSVERYMIQNIKRGLSWNYISCHYNICIPKKDTISKATVGWVKSKLQEGLSKDDIAKLNGKFSESDFNRIFNIIEQDCVCND